MIELEKWQGESLVRATQLCEYFGAKKPLQLPQKVVVWDQSLKAISQKWNSSVEFAFGLQSVRDSSGSRAFVRSLGLGAPAAAITLEILKVHGVTEVIHVGTAGALSSQVNVGDWLCAISAFRDEGTSRHYLPPGERAEANFSMVQKWESQLKSWGLRTWTGALWTTDALFRETSAAVEYYQKQHALAVEMEASALLATAHHLKMQIICLRLITDRLMNGQWTPQFKSESVRCARETFLNALVTEAWI